MKRIIIAILFLVVGQTSIAQNTFPSSGNVGIGTTNPGNDLEIAPSTHRPALWLNAKGTGNSLNTDIFLGDNNIKKWSITHRPHDQNSDFVIWRNNNGWSKSMSINYSSGNLGIGTTTPYAHSRLHIKAPTAQPWGIVAESSSNDRIIGMGHDGTNGVIATSYLGSGGFSPLQFRTSNVDRMTLDVDGNVGIGTTTPEKNLHVYNSLNDRIIIAESGGSSAGIKIKGTIKSYELWTASSIANNGFGILDFDASVYRLSIDGLNGNVGIGTTNPSSKLHVAGDGAVIKLQDTDHEDSENEFHGWIGGYDKSGDEIWWLGEGSSGSKALGLHTSRPGYDLRLFNSGKGIIIDNSGNVGIGTTSPTKLLHISSSAPSFLLERAGSTSWETRIDNNGRFIIQDASNATEPLKIESLAPTATIYAKSNGNVGIGTADPKSKLSVNGEIRATRVKVLEDISVPDYVFEEDYELRTLQETKAYITANKHLPEIPSAAEIGKDGIDLGDMNMRLLKKIEELTLYQIQLMEEMGEMKKELLALKNVSSK